jgi:hypothetical protein
LEDIQEMESARRDLQISSLHAGKDAADIESDALDERGFGYWAAARDLPKGQEKHLRLQGRLLPAMCLFSSTSGSRMSPAWRGTKLTGSIAPVLQSILSAMKLLFSRLPEPFMGSY